MNNGTPEAEMPFYTPSFANVSPATWRALESCTRDRDLVEGLWQALASRGRFQRATALPMIEETLSARAQLSTLTGRERSDIAQLLFGVFQAAFEAHTATLFADP